MHKYIVTAKSARIAGGIIELTADQAKPRLHNLRHVADQRYEIVNPVEFKQGEAIGFDGNLPKSLVNLIESEESAKARHAEKKGKGK